MRYCRTVLYDVEPGFYFVNLRQAFASQFLSFGILFLILHWPSNEKK